MFEIIFLSLLLVQTLTQTATGYSDPHFLNNRTVIVHLMEWKYRDIANECEKFLGPKGYGGVQLSPVTECTVLENRPWFERYQPVSYEIISRSGTEQEFKEMVERCFKVGIRVYVDVVLNHMTKNTSGIGMGGSTYNATSLESIYYSGLNLSYSDFHDYPDCPYRDLAIHNYSDVNECRNCQLLGYRDLNQNSSVVREKQIDFLNKLIAIGVGGFRVAASRFMWPHHLQPILSSLHNLNITYFKAKSRPFVYHYISETDVLTESWTDFEEYENIGRVVQMNYTYQLSSIIRKRGNYSLKDVFNFPEDYYPSDNSFVMIDSHLLQRGHIDNIKIAYFEPRLLKIATALMLSWPYGVPKVMSSYYWPRKFQNKTKEDLNSGTGPPSINDTIIDVILNPDLSCNKEWICEHRWRQVYNMVGFKNIAANERVGNQWHNNVTGNAIAFSRGNKAFIAINNDKQILNQNLETGLPPGKYCDVISGNLFGSKCSGKQIDVKNDGTAQIVIDNKSEDPIIAFHIKSKIKSNFN